MKLIDVLVKQANKEIKEGTILKVPDEGLFGKKSIFEFEFYGGSFYSEEGLSVEELYPLDTDFLNSEVELIPPKEKKYLIRVNIQGLHEDFAYLNYSELQSYVVIDSKFDFERCRTHFTKKEMQSIQPVREFLEDMQGKYELIGVDDNEID
ncbi:hypothetical protein [Enterococcus cecorum]|uniref:hypothetical protein n=1 Tax=Enterococcus cecorum TaxID=44008 RepID=UPI000643B951|nr:hypothetical protein [Enterococcus cecorum]KLO71581.1 hypothetical protein AA989_09885 [Enterococcus cecorum]